MQLCDVLHDEPRFEMALIEKVLVSYFFFLAFHCTMKGFFLNYLKNEI